jgi:hypothetical protein
VADSDLSLLSDDEKVALVALLKRTMDDDCYPPPSLRHYAPPQHTAALRWARR